MPDNFPKLENFNGHPFVRNELGGSRSARASRVLACACSASVYVRELLKLCARAAGIMCPLSVKFSGYKRGDEGSENECLGEKFKFGVKTLVLANM